LPTDSGHVAIKLDETGENWYLIA